MALLLYYAGSTTNYFGSTTYYCLLRLDATELRVDEPLLEVRVRGRVRARVRVSHVLVG